ncbi:outer membrane lipoprotein carrier protein LolA [Asaia sp. HN010]|uniref:LolA family protein n=1 Tax=Asaia sp. HN010 TaxID=3081233 RepID=UPI0030169846
MKAATRLFSALVSAGALAGCAVNGMEGLSTPQQREAHRVEAALNRPVTLEGHFVQMGPGQNGGAGHFSYRPGALALDYVSPHPMTLRASGTHLVLDDKQTGAVTRVSLARNPLGLLLHIPVRFTGAIRVTDIRATPGAAQISLAESDNPSQGLLTLQLIETKSGLQLASLDGVDARGNRIVLSLSEVIETGASPKN